MCSSHPQSEREVLPTNVKPVQYDVTVEPNFETFKFDGQETIELKVIEKTDTIILHSLEIEITEAKLNDTVISDFSFNTADQTVTFQLKDHLVEGSTAKLHLKFVGELNDKMAGFYRSSYEEDGKTKYLATTQMEPTDCRRAFPCIDEPSAKATFIINLIAHKDLVCLSNMDEKETTLLADHKKKVTFNETPLMSTYLVAFIVGDLKYVENNDYKVPIKVYATSGTEKLGQYSADVAAKTLAFFDKKFDIPYPLPKCDMVAIHDFSAGAMENFGLITYRTVDLLLDADNANVNHKTRVTEVVAHELAHQWFGNLVTMDWWDGLWLNEGFATWMSWYACDSLYPEWKVWESYVSDTLQHALNLDSLRSSHPVQVPVKNSNEINQIFDAISYSKGSAILKMLSKWLGEETFIKGVSQYLKKHKWGNAKTSDLWEALSAVSGKEVVKVMDVWTKEIGFPVIKVEEGSGSITVTQNRFLNTGDAKPEEDKTLYPIFLALKTSDGVTNPILDGRSQTIQIDTKDDFFKINSDQFGIFRTAYEPSRWAKLSEAGVAGKLSIEDRVGLVADAGSLASAGYIDSSSVLSLVKSWSKESNYVVWDEILKRVSAIKRAFIWSNQSTVDALKGFVRELVSEKSNEIGWEFSSQDSYAEQQLKTSMFSTLVYNDDKKAIEYGRNAFEKYVNGDSSAINPNIRSAIFASVAINGGQKDFEQLLKIYKETKIIDEKLIALRSLGLFKDSKVIDQVLDLLLQTKVIKQQDIYKPMSGLVSHTEGITKLWAWIKKNWTEVEKLFPEGSSILSGIVSVSTSGFATAEGKADVEKFFADKDTKGYNQILNQSMDVVTAKIALVERDSKVVEEWLSVNGYTK